MAEALEFGMSSYKLSASLICADLLNLERDIKSLEKAGVDYLHFDVMDGIFVPRFGLLPELLSRICHTTYLPVDVHMMVVNPEPYIADFVRAGAKIFYVHVENNPHLHRTLKTIKAAGMQPGVVLNMSSPLEYLDYIVEELDYVMLMGINPGIIGHKIIPKIFDKLIALKKKLAGASIRIMIDGGVTPDTSADLIKAGADILVCGSSSIFRPNEGNLEETAEQYRAYVDSKLSNS